MSINCLLPIYSMLYINSFDDEAEYSVGTCLLVPWLHTSPDHRSHSIYVIQFLVVHGESFQMCVLSVSQKCKHIHRFSQNVSALQWLILIYILYPSLSIVRWVKVVSDMTVIGSLIFYILAYWASWGLNKMFDILQMAFSNAISCCVW